MARTSTTAPAKKERSVNTLIGNVKRDKLAKDKKSGGQFWSVPDSRKGADVIILPPNANNNEFYAISDKHWYGKTGFQCLKNVHGASARCYFCKKAAIANRDGDKEAEELFRSQRKYNFFVFDLSDPEAGIQLWPAGVKVGKKILSVVDNSRYGDVLSPEGGRSFNVTKEGQGRTTSYDAVPAPEREDWPEELFDLIDELGEIPDITATVVETHSYDQMKEAFESLEDEDEDDEESPSEPARKVTRKALEVQKNTAAKKPEVDVIEDDEDDEDEDPELDEVEDDDEDDEPITSDDYDEDEDEDEEEDAKTVVANLRSKLKGK